MRLFEIVLATANFLALCVTAIQRLRSERWMKHGALIAAPMACIQLLVEGPRWQMIPAYALALIFFMVWLFSVTMPAGRYAGRLIEGLSIGLAVLAFMISVALPTALPVFHFPKPTGPYAIGTTTYHWIDNSRPELFTASPNDRRELMAQVWYPAVDEPSAPRAPYIQDADAVTPALARLIHFPRFFFSHFAYVRSNAVVSAPVAEGKSSYPVLVFLSGLGGFRAVNTFQIEELVSHGYVVVGLDQPGAEALVRFPDGRQVPLPPLNEIQSLINQSVDPQPQTPTLFGRALPDGVIPYFGQDVSFALDQLAALNASDPHHILTRRLDLEHAGAFGISLGGMIAAQASWKDRRLKACLIMDVAMPVDVVKAGLQQPTMFLTRDADTMRLERRRAGGWPEKEIKLTLTTMWTVYKSLRGDDYYLQIPGIFHVNFTDFPYWSPMTSQLGLTGPVDSQRMFDIINAYSRAFFDTYLKGQSTPLLDGRSPQYPEVLFQSAVGRQRRLSADARG